MKKHRKGRPPQKRESPRALNSPPPSRRKEKRMTYDEWLTAYNKEIDFKLRLEAATNAWAMEKEDFQRRIKNINETKGWFAVRNRELERELESTKNKFEAYRRENEIPHKPAKEWEKEIKELKDTIEWLGTMRTTAENHLRELGKKYESRGETLRQEKKEHAELKAAYKAVLQRYDLFVDNLNEAVQEESDYLTDIERL